jgi:DNA-binding NtrC family response regulator
MSEWLRELGYRVDTAANLGEANTAIDKRPYDLALVDVRLGDQDGFDVLAHARKQRPDTSVVMMTGYGSVESAVEAIRQGAFDFLTKPLIDAELQLAIERALNQQKLIEENKNLVNQLEARYGLENIVGHDHRMRKTFDVIASIADTKASVLITGESGTGKSMVARAIHRRSSRRGGPFVEVACGALPETLLESELFGHAAGSFTGAIGDKVGKFKQADGGTIFLDEIGTASPGMQVKLLRVLQDFEFEPVGGTKTERVDTRVILATNENLDQLVQQGKFRLDLYYRVNVINIELPALRERITDIPLLASHFLQEVCTESGRTVTGFTADAIASLQRYGWPGNVRELQNVVERAVLLGKGDTIGVDDLPATLSSFRPVTVEAVGAQTLKQALQAPERQMIMDVLEAHHCNRQETAAALGMNRTTLYKKMKKLGLETQPSANMQ